MGELKQGSNPHMGQTSESEEKHLRLGVKQLICGSLNGMRIRTCCSHTYPGQGRRSPGSLSGWELEFRDCGAIPGAGLLWTTERRTEGTCGRRLWWEMPVEESRQPWKQGDTVESRVGRSHHQPLSSHTPALAAEQQRLAPQTPDTLNDRAGPFQALL